MGSTCESCNFSEAAARCHRKGQLKLQLQLKKLKGAEKWWRCTKIATAAH